MKQTRMSMTVLLLFLICLLAFSGCGQVSQDAPETQPSINTLPAESEAGETTEAAAASLEDLLGPDYVTYITETILMQMENRMEKTPEVSYYPITEDAPLSNYVTIGETTNFEVDEDGNPVILFPAGTVTEERHGEQRFILPKLYS